jgi:hypothetical protein
MQVCLECGFAAEIHAAQLFLTFHQLTHRNQIKEQSCDSWYCHWGRIHAMSFHAKTQNPAGPLDQS